MIELITIGSLVLLFIAVITLAVYYGEERQKSRQAQKELKTRNRDAEITAEPFIYNPFSRMRSKK